MFLLIQSNNITHRLVFFFSSRRRHTRYWRDWSSDVCSSDLRCSHQMRQCWRRCRLDRADRHRSPVKRSRSEERRVGKECRSRCSPYHQKKKRGGSTDAGIRVNVTAQVCTDARCRRSLRCCSSVSFLFQNPSLLFFFFFKQKTAYEILA